MNLTYEPYDFAIEANFLMNDESLFRRSISGKESFPPSPSRIKYSTAKSGYFNRINFWKERIFPLSSHSSWVIPRTSLHFLVFRRFSSQEPSAAVHAGAGARPPHYGPVPTHLRGLHAGGQPSRVSGHGGAFAEGAVAGAAL